MCWTRDDHVRGFHGESSFPTKRHPGYRTRDFHDRAFTFRAVNTAGEALPRPWNLSSCCPPALSTRIDLSLWRESFCATISCPSHQNWQANTACTKEVGSSGRGQKEELGPFAQRCLAKKLSASSVGWARVRANPALRVSSAGEKKNGDWTKPFDAFARHVSNSRLSS